MINSSGLITTKTYQYPINLFRHIPPHSAHSPSRPYEEPSLWHPLHLPLSKLLNRQLPQHNPSPLHPPIGHGPHSQKNTPLPICNS